MAVKQLHIPEEDLKSLQSFLRVAPGRYELDRQHLQALSDGLDRARTVASHECPPDVVTMYSHVLLRDLSNGEEMECVPVFPEEADIALGRISVVAPIGAAILGRRVGETVTIHVPAGTRRLRIKRLLYQPESAARVAEEAGA